MSRSRKKVAITGLTTSESEKFDKILIHRKIRRKSKEILRDIETADEKLIPDNRDVSNVWAMAKDGKHYVPKGTIWHEKAKRK